MSLKSTSVRDTASADNIICEPDVEDCSCNRVSAFVLELLNVPPTVWFPVIVTTEGAVEVPLVNVKLL